MNAIPLEGSSNKQAYVAERDAAGEVIGASTGAFKSISGLRDSILSPGKAADNSEWAAKMLHAVPDLPTVKDRGKYLVEKARGKVVLDIGCTGPISAAIKAVAARYCGVDQADAAGILVVDLDRTPEDLPVRADFDVVICSEVLEHLANPGYFLAALKKHYGGLEIYITVPNAGAYTVKDGCEVVNKDHVAWYSYTTLKTLLTRYGFEIERCRWYHGQPHKAEGLIFVVT